MPARKFLFLFLLSGLVTALLLEGASLAISMRPAEMKHEIERKLAANIAAGRYAMPPQTFDERALRWQTIADLHRSPDMVVIGSSHGLRVTGTMLDEPDLQNFSVTGGMMPDGYVTTELLARQRIKPRIWVIFVEPWFFDVHADISLWKQRAAVAAAFERHLASMKAPRLPAVYEPRIGKAVMPALLPPLSLSPLIDWLEEQIRVFRFDPNPPDDGRLTGLALRGDGSFFLTWEATEPEGDSTELAQRQFHLDADRYRYGNYPAQDPVLWDYFARWIDHCRSQGGQVWLILPPFHPAIYPRIVSTPGNQLSSIEARARALAAKQGCTVIGSYNPDSLGLVPADFEDGDHLNDRGLTRLFAPYALKPAASPGGTSVDSRTKP